MTPKDKRSLDHQTLEYLRELAVQRVLNGERPSDVAELLGFYRTSIYRWLRAHKKHGQQALKSRVAKGPEPKLTDKQKQQVVRWVVGKDPRQYGFDFGLWTRGMIQEMIRERFQVEFTLPSVGRLLHQLGITPQKPLRRSYERDEKEVEEWKTQEYPRLKKRAKGRGADIFFLDEAGVRSDSVLGRSWGRKGETPVGKTSGQRQQINAISAVNAQGAFWFEAYTGRFNAGRFVDFMKSFLKTRRRPVILVVDGHPAHKAKVVKEYVESLKGKLELVFLPPYAPDLNPDEFVWNHLKGNGTAKKPLKKNESLKVRVINDLKNIQKDKKLIQSFFLAESVSYAAY